MQVSALAGGALAICLCLSGTARAAVGENTDTPIWRALHGPLLAIDHAGPRLVAVGDRGIILLSDDSGANWRMAESHSDALLTAAVFTSPAEGWVVGQDSTILHTADAGASWAVQATPKAADQALFSIASLATAPAAAAGQPAGGGAHLVATGAYALMLETQDGQSWTPVKLPNLDEDYHLNCVMRHGEDVVVTGEAGHVFVRHNATWTPMPVGYDGSQFGCLSRPDGTMYSFGLRGSLFVSTPAAPAWRRIETGEQRSIFSAAVLANGFLGLVGGNGLMLLYDPQTGHVRKLPAVTSAALSGLAEIAGGKWVMVGDDGVHVFDPAAANEQAAEVTQ